MKKNGHQLVIAWFFILLFLYSGISKLTGHQLFKEELVAHRLPTIISTWLSWMVPLAELMVSTLLMRSTWRRSGLYASCLLMTFFTGYLIITAGFATVGCGCGGILEALSPVQHLVFNMACICLSLVGVFSVEDGVADNTGARSYPARHRPLKPLSTSAIVILLAIIGSTVLMSLRTPAAERTGLEGKPLPAFNVLLADSTTRINTRDIPTGSRILVIEFSPFCPFCRAEITDIVRHIDYFRNTRIYLLTSFPYKDLKEIYNDLKIDRYPNIRAGIDSGNQFMVHYNAKVVPYTAVYDDQKRLVRAMRGRVQLNTLLRLTTDKLFAQ